MALVARYLWQVCAERRHIDLHAGQFAEHAIVEFVAVEEIDAAGLLSHMVGDAAEGDLAVEIDAGVDQGLHRADLAAEAGLHVHDAVAEKPPLLDGAVERIARPALANRLGVEMAGQQKMRAGLAAVDFPQHVEMTFRHGLAPDLADAEGLEARFDAAGEFGLLAVGAVDSHHLLGHADRGVERQARADFFENRHAHDLTLHPLGTGAVSRIPSATRLLPR